MAALSFCLTSLLFPLAVLLTGFGQVSSASVLPFTIWRKTDDHDFSLMTSQNGAGSLTRCAATCALTFNCMNFCYNKDSSDCYVEEWMMNDINAGTLAGGFDCFRRYYQDGGVTGGTTGTVGTSETTASGVSGKTTETGIAGGTTETGATGGAGVTSGTTETGGVIECPTSLGYQNFSGRCIKLYDSPCLGYTNATDRCVQDGAHLYHFKTLDDLQPLLDLFSNHGYPPFPSEITNGVWVGADDLQSQGNYVWSDGTPLNSTADVWADGVPDSVVERCVQYKHTGRLLNDFMCDAELFFVCQVTLG